LTAAPVIAVFRLEIGPDLIKICAPECRKERKVPKRYKEQIDRRLIDLKQDDVMRDLYKHDPRDSAQIAGDFFHIMADTVKDRPDSPTAKLFRKAELNPEHPFAWGYLIEALAEIHIVNRRSGRRKIQDKDFQRRLRTKVKEIMKPRSKPPTDRHLAILLQTRHGQDYPTIKTTSGFISLLKRHKIATADIWAASKPRKRARRSQGPSSGEVVEPVRAPSAAKIRD
jgi:hypothetical protein